jgi:glycosyltransferase involved in cell wall biosynthesis
VSVGNSSEIAQWTGAGVVCPSSVDNMGYTQVNDEVLGVAMSELMTQQDLLEHLGQSGRRNWAEKFTWEKIATQYEQLFKRLL